MKDFFMNTKNVRGYANRLMDVENTLQSLSLLVDNMSSTLKSIGLGQIVPNIVLLSNQLSINSKKVNSLSESLNNIVSRYILAEDNITSLSTSSNQLGKSLKQSQKNYMNEYVENMLKKPGYDKEIEYIMKSYPKYVSSLHATSHWSISDDKVLATIGAAIGAAFATHYDDFLFFPKPGSKITVSPGTDLSSYECTVADTNAWSLEYSIFGCQNSFGDQPCWERLKYAIEHYDYNKGCQDLLQFNLDGYKEPVYAGAMIEGYADIGDIVYVTLDNGEGFYFMILDTKSNHHVSSDFPNGQVQYEGGHGYITNSGSVQLSNCEFIMSDWAPGVNSAINTESGAFLNGRYVTSAEIVDHVDILE